MTAKNRKTHSAVLNISSTKHVNNKLGQDDTVYESDQKLQRSRPSNTLVLDSSQSLIDMGKQSSTHINGSATHQSDNGTILAKRSITQKTVDSNGSQTLSVRQRERRLRSAWKKQIDSPTCEDPQGDVEAEDGPTDCAINKQTSFDSGYPRETMMNVMRA